MMSRVVLSALVLATVFLALFVDTTTAQINFSPSWGKRGGATPIPDACRPSTDSIMYIYKLIQTEAQKIVDCSKFTN